MEASVVRLRALSGTPLAESVVRDTVVAAARALAERMGVALGDLRVAEDSITLALGLDKLAAMGFLAELRRSTNAWYEAKYHDGPLWGTPPPGRDESSE